MWISPETRELQYSGRIDFDDRKAPVLVYACSSIRLMFCGTAIEVELENHRSCWKNEMGYFLDGKQGKFALTDGAGRHTYRIAEGLEDEKHELLLFKRMDSCHTVTFYGFGIDGERVALYEPPEKPVRKIEFFGDSVSCGEVSEALDYIGKEDPIHDGQYSNSWYSYAWMTARKLKAEIHDTSQGGIALLDGTGWFAAPDYKGMESCYDKIEYHPDLGPVKQWDFSKFHPQVVVIAIGQNDSHPYDYMAVEPEGKEAERWKEHYFSFVKKIAEQYPGAQIILTTTILCHNKNWDLAIKEVAERIGEKRIHHFLYTKNGCGTPGHIRIPEAEEMAEELSTYIESLGEEIWKAEE